MALWVVRAGRRGEREGTALRESCALIGFHELGDLSDITEREQLRPILESALPDRSAGAIANYVGQLWAFKERIQIGDLVALPLHSTASIAFGRITGPYQYEETAPTDARHRRPVEWIRDDVPRTAFDRDLLFSLGGASTVFQVRRNDAESRITAVVSGGSSVEVPVPEADTAETPEPTVDVEEYGRDQIRTLIDRRFAGHALARLVDAVLRAKGYTTHLSPEGPDQGVDVLAGGGPMGLDQPRIAVQVKTGTVDSPTVSQLQGAMDNFGAEQGLMVAWGGFRRGVEAEARRRFFRLRLWDSDKLIDELTSVYERLPADLRDELPLTQVWAVVGDAATDEP
jgi:restriction system protein